MSVHIAFETPQDVQEQVYEMGKSLGKDGKGRLKKGANEVTKAAERGTAPVSYTHLTLPTIYSV